MRETLKPAHLKDENIVRFIGNYVHTRSITQASSLSGLSNSEGKVLLSRPDIYKCIQKITQSALVKYGYDAEEVVERVKELAFADIGDLFDENGMIIENPRDLPPEVRRAVKKFKYKAIFENDINGVPQYKGRLYDVELWDKPKSLELLGREKDTFKKTNVIQHDVSKNAADFLLGSLKRAEERVQSLKAPESDVIDVTPPKIAFAKPPGVK